MSTDDQGQRYTTDPAEALVHLFEEHRQLQQRVLELEVTRRVDQDFMHCMILMQDDPARLQLLWQHAVSAITAGTVPGWFQLDEHEQARGQHARDAMSERMALWHRLIQSAMALRAADD